MNIIFLDVDGVLNSLEHLDKVYLETGESHSGYEYPFDPNCLKNLQNLVHLTNSKLVISSTWRINLKGILTLIRKLKEYNLDREIIGYTPILKSKVNRGEEISSFLSTLDYEPNFIILDDNSDMGELLPHLVKTNIRVGLTKKNVEEAVQKLNSPIIKRSKCKIKEEVKDEWER